MSQKTDLQAKATELGIVFTDETTVKELKESIAAKEGTGSGSTGVPAQNLGKAEIMRRKLADQPKVAIMIPLAPGELPGSTESVILNGHRVNIRKGEYVHVPQQVAQVIMESQQMTQQAIDNYFLMNSEGKSKAMLQKEA